MASVYRSLVVALAALVLTSLPTQAVANPGPGRVILIVADGLTLENLRSEPQLADWASGRAVGLMNVATAGKHGRASAWLTLGAGARARLDILPQPALPVNDETAWGELAGQAYRRRTGVVPPPGSLVNLDWQLVVMSNHSLSLPGSLASTLAGHGIPVTTL